MRVYDRLHGEPPDAEFEFHVDDDFDPAGDIDLVEQDGPMLQASWSEGEVVVWAAGPSSQPATNEELADRLEALDAPALGWRVHRGISCPTEQRAEAVSIPVADGLGWLVAVGGGLDGEGVGASVRWLGHIAISAVRQVARGAVVPTVRSNKRGDRSVDMAVRWRAALLDDATLDRYAAIMPGPVRVTAPPSVASRTVVTEIIGAVVHAVVAQAAGMLELPAPPPKVRTASDVGESIITRLDGSSSLRPPASVRRSPSGCNDGRSR